MLRLLLVATLCAAALAAPRPNAHSTGNTRGHGPSRGGTRIKPGSVNGDRQPIGMPRTLPSMLTTQLENLFQQMQLQQDAHQLELTQWENRVQGAVEGWWAAISQRLSMGGRDQTFPEEIATSMRQKITEAFTLMKNEVAQGNTLNLDHWLEVLRGYTSDSWTQFVDRTLPNQPDYTIDRPRGNKPGRVDKPGRGDRFGQGEAGRGQRPTGRGDRQQTGHQGRPNGRGQNSPPADLPPRMRQQLTDIFTGMQEEYDVGNLAIPDWHNQTKNTFQDWWTRVKGRLQDQNIPPPGRQNAFPDEVHPKIQERIQEVFDGIQEEVNAGRDPDMTQWENRMGEHAERWWDKVVEKLTNGNEPGRGHGPRDHGIPDNMPPKMKQTLQELFAELKQEVDSGNQLDLDVWRNRTLDMVEGWWGRMSNMAEKKNPKAAEKKPFFDDIPTKWLEQVNDLFERMQLKIDNGETLDIGGWHREMSRSVQRWWDAFARRVDPERPVEPRKNFPDLMPERMTAPVHDVFNRIQEKIDNQDPLDLMQYHDEIQEMATSWFNRFTSMKDGIKGKPSKKREMPVEMRAQITDVFTRMRGENNTGQWDVDVWRNETLAMAQEWWEKFTSKITDNLEMTVKQWIATLQEIFQEVNSTDTFDLERWRELVLNKSASWLNFNQTTLGKWGFRSREDVKFLERLGSRIPQHVNHIFDRMKLKSMDGLPLDLAKWEQELENLAAGWGKRIRAHIEQVNEPPRGRPDQPQRPDRPRGRPDVRPERPNGRPGNPNKPDRPGRPNRPGKPQDRPSKPNGRPDRTQDRPQRPEKGSGGRKQNGRKI